MYLSPYLEPQTTVSPQVVLASELLQLSATDLEQRIHQELAENPALELIEPSYCAQCGMPVAEGRWLCHHCAQQSRDGSEHAEQREDVGAWVPARTTLKQHLWAQLRLLLPISLHSLAELVIGYLDEHGFLLVSVEELARRHGISIEAVAQVVEALHQVEPVGVGAGDVREALLIQIEHLARTTDAPRLSLARSIVREHWTVLRKGEKVWAEIAQAQGVSVTDVREAVGFIILDLNPFPAHAWVDDSSSAPPSGNSILQPDILLYQVSSSSENRFAVELLERHRFRLRISELYAELAEGRVEDADQDDVDMARYYLEGARLFLHSVHQRRRTMARVSLELADYQHDFVLRGSRYLRPLTRARLAERLGVHESTISRAVAHKYIQMPDQRVIPLADFFDGSLPAKHDLQVLISQEDEAHPLSDRALAVKLRGLGHDIRRRTVTKYRQALGIPSSRLRQLAAQCRDVAHQVAVRTKAGTP